jgi:hypothetical protein
MDRVVSQNDLNRPYAGLIYGPCTTYRDWISNRFDQQTIETQHVTLQDIVSMGFDEVETMCQCLIRRGMRLAEFLSRVRFI